MKTLTFNYTKKDGTTSERTLLVTSEPRPATDKYSGIDLSNIGPDLGAEFAARYEEAYNWYLDDLEDLKAEFDLKHNFRQFFESGMSNVIEI